MRENHADAWTGSSCQRSLGVCSLSSFHPLQLLSRNAFGNYRTLLKEITLDVEGPLDDLEVLVGALQAA